MKILLASPYLPSASSPHAGGLSVFHLLCGFARRAEVTLATLRRPGELLSPELSDACARILSVEHRARPVGGAGGLPVVAMERARSVLRSARSGRPLFVEKYWVPELAAGLQDLCERECFDIAQLEFPMMAQYRSRIRARAMVLDVHEVRSTRPGHARAEERRWRRYERESYCGFDRIVTVTERDRRALLDLAPHFRRVSERVQVIPQGVATDEYSPTGGREEVGRLAFVGDFANEANSDAALWLSDEILPRIREVQPRARLALVGGGARGAICRLAGREGIEVTGWVERVQDELARAQVVLAPVRIGAGIRIKVLQALAMGKAVVCTSLGAEGIPGVDGRHYRVADSAQGIAQAVCELMGSRVVRASYGAAGRELVCEHFGWPVILRAFETLHQSALADAAAQERGALA